MTKNELYAKIGIDAEKRIFEYYLGIPVVLKRMFKSPLRRDKRPTANFYYHQNTLFYKDFNHIAGDAIKIVQLLYNLDYYQAINRIAEDLGVKDNKPVFQIAFNPIQEKKKTSIIVYGDKWKKHYLDYWKQYYITKEVLLKYNVQPVKYLWINERIHFIRRNSLELIFDYKFTNEERKIYFPQRNTNRFLCNTNRIQGFRQLPPTDEIVVITKSLKDVMVLSLFGIPAIAPQSEICITEELYTHLEKRFKLIICNYDKDYKGVQAANQMKKKYGIPAIMLHNNKEDEKDISDYIKKYGFDTTKQMIYEISRRTRF